MNLTRVIGVYSQTNEELIMEFQIDDIPVSTLRTILPVKENDPDVLMIYPINNKELIKFSEFIPELLSLDLKQVKLFFECFEIPN